MKISINDFSGGISPVKAGQLLAINEAQNTTDCYLSSGELRNWIQELSVSTIGNTGTVQTLFLLNDTYWIGWSAQVDVTSGCVSQNNTGRFYYTGDSYPKKSDTATAIGSPPYPSASYHLGVQKPQSALTATLGGGGSGIAMTRNYVVTNVTAWGEESAPGAVSNDVNALPGQTVMLTNIPLGNSGYNISRRRVYRSVTGTSGTAAYQFLTEIADNTTTTFTDSMTDAQTGSVLNTTTWIEPPSSLAGLVTLPIQVMAGFLGKDIYFTPTGIPYAWPIQNIIAVEYNVIGLAVQGSNLVVCTDQYPYLITGYDPSSMSCARMPDLQPCVSKRGIVSCASGVVYPTPDGLYMISGTTGQLLTEGKFDKKTWKNLYPATAHAYVYNNHYFMFYNGGVGASGCLVVNLSNKVCTDLDMYTTSAYVWKKTDQLYFLKQRVV